MPKKSPKAVMLDLEQTPAEGLHAAMKEKTLGEVIDLLVMAQKERKAREVNVDSAQRVESLIKAFLIDNFDKAKLTGAKGKKATVSLREKDKPKIVDYEAFCKYVAKNEAWDLFQRRPGEAACQARWEDGVEIPGVEKFHVKEISLTDVK